MKTKPVKVGHYGKILTTLQLVLRSNLQKVLDEETLSLELTQETGCAQRDTLFFTLFVPDLYYELKWDDLEVIFYDDELAPESSSHFICNEVWANLNCFVLETTWRLTSKIQKKGNSEKMKNFFYLAKQSSTLIHWVVKESTFHDSKNQGTTWTT